MNARLSSRRISFIRQFLRTVTDEEEFVFREFCDRIVAADGAFLLRMLSANTNELFTQEVLCVLWDSYRAQAQLLQVVHKKGNDDQPLKRRSLDKGGASSPPSSAGSSQRREENIDTKVVSKTVIDAKTRQILERRSCSMTPQEQFLLPLMRSNSNYPFERRRTSAQSAFS